MNWKIPLADIAFGPEEEEAVLKVLRRGWLTMGSETEAFEAEFAAYTGTKHAIAVTNCTAALHLSCIALGLGPGDEVIVPSLSFVATANAVRYTGATPIFADIVSEKDLSISPDDITAKITSNTRAIIVMHYAGYPCDMIQIMSIAEHYKLPVIEDAAHAPGSFWGGRALGAWGSLGCYSFFSNKNMTTGEGGMIITDDKDLAKKLQYLRSHGMTTVTWDRHKGHAWSYDVVDAGYNYRIDEIRSAIGLIQLKKLKDNNARRHVLNEQYIDMLTEFAPEISIPYSDNHGDFAYHIRPIILPKNRNRVAFMNAMKEKRIQTSIHYPPIHQFSSFRDNISKKQLPITEEVAKREVTLPLFSHMKPEEVSEVVYAIREALGY